jgi:hypothetical protein
VIQVSGLFLGKRHVLLILFIYLVFSFFLFSFSSIVRCTVLFFYSQKYFSLFYVQKKDISQPTNLLIHQPVCKETLGFSHTTWSHPQATTPSYPLHDHTCHQSPRSLTLMEACGLLLLVESCRRHRLVPPPLTCFHLPSIIASSSATTIRTHTPHTFDRPH